MGIHQITCEAHGDTNNDQYTADQGGTVNDNRRQLIECDILINKKFNNKNIEHNNGSCLHQVCITCEYAQQD